MLKKTFLSYWCRYPKDLIIVANNADATDTALKLQKLQGDSKVLIHQNIDCKLPSDQKNNSEYMLPAVKHGNKTILNQTDNDSVVESTS